MALWNLTMQEKEHPKPKMKGGLQSLSPQPVCKPETIHNAEVSCSHGFGNCKPAQAGMLSCKDLSAHHVQHLPPI